MKSRSLLGAALATALLASSCSLTAAAAPPTDPGPPPLSDVTSLSLADPATESKPEVRWWLSQGAHTEETIKESVTEIADSGFAGIEFAMLNETRVDAATWAYGSKEWVNDVKLIVTEATKHGLSASFTSGTHWSTANIPGLDPNSEGAGHDVGSAHALVSSGSTLTTVPTPTIAAGRTQSFVSAVAYKLTNTYTTTPTTRAPLEFDHTSAVDLTADAQDGTIDFTAEDGDWVVFSFWYRGTGQQSSPATSPAYAINYFDTAGFEALKTYWESYLFADEELVAAIRDNGKIQMFMDSLEFSNSQSGAFGNFSMFWTSQMKQEFQERKGYDITPYLPALIGSPDLWTTGAPTTGTVTFAGDEGRALRDRVVSDLRDVQTRLYMENLLTPLRSWLNEEYGIKLRAQISYGKNVEISMPITAVDFPETETRNQRDQTDVFRVHAGGAHLQNKVYSSETSAHSGMNYGFSLQEYLQHAYTQYAGGVNRVIWHGYASQWGPKDSVRWPGYEAGMGAITGRWGERNPSAQDYSEYNDHLGRVQTVLRAGVPQVDLAVLYSDYAYQLNLASTAPSKELEDLKQQKHEGWHWKDLALQDQGFTYDYFAPQYLEDGFAPFDAESGLIAEDGPAYQALLVYQNTMPLSSAESLRDMAREGLKVVLVEGAMTKPLFESDSADDLAAVRAELTEMENVRVVADQKSASAALADLGVTPRVEYGEPDEELLSVTRKDDDASYLFLYNYYNVINGWNDDFTEFDKAGSWSEEAVTNTVEVKGTVKPYLLDTWTGEITEVATFSHENGRTVVPVEIPDGDVRVYIFKDSDEGGVHVASTDADEVHLANGEITVRSTATGEASVELSDGSTHTVSATVPDARSLTGWDLNIESWNPGELSAPRSETTELGNYTEEYTYLTAKSNIRLQVDELATWDALEGVGENVVGIGTYETTFDWDSSSASGAYLDLGPLVESATVFVNDVKTENVNIVDAQLDIPAGLLIDGENRLRIVVTSNLANKMLELGYNGGNLTEGPRSAGRDINGNPNFRYDHVFTHFGYGVSQAVLTPYVDSVIGEEPMLDVDTSVTTRCIGGKNVLQVTAVNLNDVPVDVVIATEFGEKTVTGVSPDKKAFHGFTTRQVELPAGDVTITATAEIDGIAAEFSESVGYDAATCR